MPLNKAITPDQAIGHASIQMKRLIINDYLVTVGGEQHSGWLPMQAVEPLPTPVRELYFDFVIKESTPGVGYIFEYYSQCGEFFNDTWHETLEDAKAQAQQDFGIPLDAWSEEKP